MRDPKRIWPFLSKLAELWELKPDYRFWQLLQSIPLDRDPFFLEEDETEAILDKEIAEIKAWQKEQQEKYKLYKPTPREETIARFIEYTNRNKER
nr:MAG TPA: Protein of unknown function (DUF1040) [Caudoviricetes sp.]